MSIKANSTFIVVFLLLSFSGRPQGKSYLFFTQFKAEITGSKMEYASAYVSILISKLTMIVFI